LRRPASKTKALTKLVKSPAKGKKATAKKSGKRGGIWIPDENTRPGTSAWQRKAVEVALKRGHVVLLLQGKFFRVPLSQRLSLKRSGSELDSNHRYVEAQTVQDSFKLGAMPGDLNYDFNKGLLKFLPSLEGTPVDTPLPRSEWPPGIRPCDGHAPWWLPANWAHGVKTTCKTYLPVYIAPNTRTVYHQPVVEAIVHEELGGTGPGGTGRIVEWALKRMSEVKDWSGQPIKFDQDTKFFACLSAKERSHLPAVDAFHFGVISARRANELSGIRGLVNVQSRLLACGIRPTWYVDQASLKDYQKLGLDAVVGGKLCPSRNKALRDAAKLGKVCVQVSDDITGWEFMDSKLDAAALRAKGSKTMLGVANAAVNSSRIVVSPLAAARFLLAKMRAAEARPRLGGVLPTGNAAMALLSQMTTPDGFILGDFFVHDASPIRFDESITLKEDYDFTCSHLQRHGSVMRCNRLCIKVAHETNPGGAVDARDAAGEKERRNIKILMKKWPGVFKSHSTRGDTQVKMKWKHLKH